MGRIEEKALENLRIGGMGSIGRKALETLRMERFIALNSMHRVGSLPESPMQNQ